MSEEETSYPVPFEIEIAKERLLAAFAAGRIEEWGQACLEMKRLLRKHEKALTDGREDLHRAGDADDGPSGL
jgi:hypothetical protein